MRDAFSPGRRAAILEDEADRCLGASQRAVEDYHQAVAEGNETRARILRSAALASLESSRRADAQADRFRELAVGANVTYSNMTGTIYVSVDAAAHRKRTRKQLKRARNTLIAEARSRMARGDRHGATSVLADAELIERRIKSRVS